MTNLVKIPPETYPFIFASTTAIKMNLNYMSKIKTIAMNNPAIAILVLY